MCVVSCYSVVVRNLCRPPYTLTFSLSLFPVSPVILGNQKKQIVEYFLCGQFTIYFEVLNPDPRSPTFSNGRNHELWPKKWDFFSSVFRLSITQKLTTFRKNMCYNKRNQTHSLQITFEFLHRSKRLGVERYPLELPSTTKKTSSCLLVAFKNLLSSLYNDNKWFR